MTTERWNPFLVTLHWLIAILVIMGLGFGILVLEEMPNTAEKIEPLRIHFIAGLIIGALMILRILTRLIAKSPPPAETGSVWGNRLRSTVHVLMYVVVLSMVSTGLGLAIMSGLPEILFGDGGQPLPDDFHEFPPRAGHGFFAKALLVLVTIHFLAALYHQFFMKDRLLSRMWFGKRSAGDR